MLELVSTDMFEVNNVGCIVSQDGGAIGYIACACNLVQEEVAQTGNESSQLEEEMGEKKLLWISTRGK